jgi:hypothetical protein
MTAVTAAFGMPAILDEISRRSAGRARLVAGAAVAATGLADLFVRTDASVSLRFFTEVRTHRFLLLSVFVACCVAAVAMSILRRSSGRIAALSAFLGAVAVVSLAPAHYLGTGQTGEFSPYGGDTEIAGYQAGYDMTRLISSKDTAASRVLLWDNLYGLADVSWANLPHQQGGIENVEAPTPIPQLTSPELDVLNYPTTNRVLAIAESPAEVAAALPALQRLGLGPRAEKSGTWADGKLHYELIELHRGG